MAGPAAEQHRIQVIADGAGAAPCWILPSGTKSYRHEGAATTSMKTRLTLNSCLCAVMAKFDSASETSVFVLRPPYLSPRAGGRSRRVDPRLYGCSSRFRSCYSPVRPVPFEHGWRLVWHWRERDHWLAKHSRQGHDRPLSRAAGGYCRQAERVSRQEWRSP
jgi:hypothetical protein